MAGPGDEINIKGGISYNDSNPCVFGILPAVVCITNSGTVEYPIIYQSWLGTGIPIIDVDIDYAILSDPFGSEVDNLVFKDIKVIGPEGDSVNAFGVKGDGIEIYNTHIENGWVSVMGIDSTIYSSLIINDTGNAISLGYSGSENNVSAYNNTISGGTVGIHANANGLLEVKNNIIINTTDRAMSWNTSAAGITFDYANNLLYGNASNYQIPDLEGNNDILQDPLFLDPSNGDYRLQSTSPAIDAGATLVSVTTDILGVYRPQVNGYDIGAYEYYTPTITVDTFTTPTNDNTPTFTGTATTVAAAALSSLEYSLNNGVWTALAPNDGVVDEQSEEFSLTLPQLADGDYSLRVRVIDSLGTEGMVEKPFTVDTVAPDPGGIEINANAESTDSHNVILSIYNSSASEMMISNSPYFTGASWEDYLVTRNWDLGTGEGLRYVYVKFRDAAGNESRYFYADSILIESASEQERESGGESEQQSEFKLEKIDFRVVDHDAADTYNPMFTTTSSYPKFSGTGTPGATITVNLELKTETDVLGVDSEQDYSCTTTVEDDGTWVCELTTELPVGTYTVRISQQDADGVVTELPELTLTIQSEFESGSGGESEQESDDVSVSDEQGVEVSEESSWLLVACAAIIIAILLLLLIVGVVSRRRGNEQLTG